MKKQKLFQKIKEAAPSIVKDIKHYAKPRVKLHNKGLGDYYSEGYRSEPERMERGKRYRI